MAKRPAPEATRAALEETIEQIRAKKADGYLIDDVWTVEQVPHPKTREMAWAVLRVALADDGTDRLHCGQRVFRKGSGAYQADEQYHINLAAQKNRAILKRAIKVLGARMLDETSANGLEPGTKPRATYTRADLDATIAYVRRLAPRVNGYETAERSDHPTLPGWHAVFYYLDADGSDHLRNDGTRVSPMGTACATEELAIRRATEGNIDRIDKIARPQWFTVRGSRNARYPREKSPALSEARQAAFHETSGYQHFAECFNG